MNSQEQSGSKGAFTSYKNPMICDQQLEFLLEGAKSCQGHDEDGHCPDHDVFSHVLSSFELPNPTLSAQQQNNNIVLGEPISLGVDKGQSSKHASDVVEYQQRESDEDDNSKEDKSNSGNRPQKRRRSAEMHNLTERLRRQRIKEKMKALQDLIPNCNKRDKTSTLDDAIKYIRTLQYQVQMMSIGAGFTMWHSPWMLPPHQPGQQGVQIPRPPTHLQTGPAPGLGVGYGMDHSSSINIPMRMLNNQCSFPSATTSGSMGTHGMSDVQLFQNSDKDLGNMSFSTSSDMSCAPFQATSNPMFGSPCTNQGE